MSRDADAIIALYDRHAALWDDVRGSELSLERGWLERFTALLAPGATILDLGCGTGEPIARYLLEHGLGVTGVDSSAALIELARARRPDAEWLVGDMRRLALGRRFDGVIAWHSSFHLTTDDQRALIPRLTAHASPGAILMFTSGHEAGEAVGTFGGEPLYHASLAPDEYRGLLADSGWSVVAVRLADPECGGASVWLARLDG